MVNHTMVSPPFLGESKFFVASLFPSGQAQIQVAWNTYSHFAFHSCLFDRQFGLMMPLMALHQRTPRRRKNRQVVAACNQTESPKSRMKHRTYKSRGRATKVVQV